MIQPPKQMIIFIILIIAQYNMAVVSGKTQIIEVQSPDKKIAVTVRLSEQSQIKNLNKQTQLEYKVDYSNKEVISYSPLGIIRADQKFTDNLKFINTVRNPVIDET